MITSDAQSEMIEIEKQSLKKCIVYTLVTIVSIMFP